LAVGYYSPAASIDAEVKELQISQSDKQLLAVQVSNIGRTTWIPSQANNTALSYRIYDEKKSLVHEGERIWLPYAIKPGDRIKLDISVTAPDQPGKYTIVIDMIQEGVAWFEDRGSKPCEIQLDVSAES
jgi:uncharacterized protein YcfL